MALFGKNSRNSLHSCAASVLLWAMTSAGLPTFSIVHAIVAVFPVPVAPMSVWNRSPATRPSDSSSIARGWSPVGRYASAAFSAVTGNRVSVSLPGEAQLTRVRAAVDALQPLHAGDVRSCLGELDRLVHRQPAVDVLLAGVVGRERRSLVAVLVEQ